MSATLETAQGLIDSLKLTQRGVLARLNAEASNARRAGNEALASALGDLAIRLSWQNLALHRARLKLVTATDLPALTQRLGAVVADANRAAADIASAADLLGRAARLIELLRRLLDAFA